MIIICIYNIISWFLNFSLSTSLGMDSSKVASSKRAATDRDPSNSSRRGATFSAQRPSTPGFHRPLLQHETQVLAGNKNQKRKGPQASQKKTYADFCCFNLLWTWMHPVNIQQTSRQFVSLCSHSHVLITPAPWKKRCEVLHHLARQVATFVQTQQPQDQRVE